MSNDALIEMSGKKPEGKKRKRPDRTAQLEPGDAQKFLGNALEISQLPQIDKHNAEEVRNRLAEYFSICIKNDVKPSVAGMGLALGMDRRDVGEYRNNGKLGKEVTDALNDGYRLLNTLMEDYMQNGKINPVSGIFLMKNNMGYKDQQDVVLTPNNPLGDLQDRKQLEERYLASIPVEVAESEIIDVDGA